ncbi:MAG: Na+/H+ antiporter NhaC family protein [Bacteroidota bacterium]
MLRCLLPSSYRWSLWTLVLLMLAAPVQAQEAAPPEAPQAPATPVEVSVPGLVLTGVPFAVTVTGPSPEARLQIRTADGAETALTYDAEQGAFTAEEVLVESAGGTTVTVISDGTVLREAATRAVPGWFSILPPALAIAVALAFKRVIPALFVGLWIGAVGVYGFSLSGLGQGLLATMQVYVLGALVDEGHASIILFSLMIGGMVGIVSRSGGMQGIVNKIIGWARTPRKGQIATGLLGLIVFFDDYANTLVVGNTMRSVTDRLKVSREKLAYIVDSTAAPVACLAFVTTWIGYQVGLIGTAVDQIDGLDVSAYSVFLNSIPYSFYPVFAIFFVFAVANSRRDFGPMYQAELRARTTGQVLRPGARVDDAAAEGEELKPPPGKPQRAVNALIPIGVLVGGVLTGLYVTGAESAGAGASLREIIGEADSYKALVWASLLGVLAAGVLAVGQRILTLEQTIEAWYGGLKSMLFAMIILVLAWALSSITEALSTAEYLVTVLGESLPVGLVPAVVFLLAAATAFATGSSWGTMGILMPLVIPLAWAVLAADGLHTSEESLHILYSTASTVLAGAVWGDHCSPISDTTILSSMASGCDHIDHVRTQLPYALTVGLVAIFIGTIPTGFGLPWWVSMVVGLGLLSVIIRTFGKRVSDEVGELAASTADA